MCAFSPIELVADAVGVAASRLSRAPSAAAKRRTLDSRAFERRALLTATKSSGFAMKETARQLHNLYTERNVRGASIVERSVMNKAHAQRM